MEGRGERRLEERGEEGSCEAEVNEEGKEKSGYGERQRKGDRGGRGEGIRVEERD